MIRSSNQLKIPLGIETTKNDGSVSGDTCSNQLKIPLGIETNLKLNKAWHDHGSNQLKIPLGIETALHGTKFTGSLVPINLKSH